MIKSEWKRLSELLNKQSKKIDGSANIILIHLSDVALEMSKETPEEEFLRAAHEANESR